jgi:hypothetical protein
MCKDEASKVPKPSSINSDSIFIEPEAILAIRYTLKRLDQSLSLAIIDHDMDGETRSVASLSGGGLKHSSPCAKMRRLKYQSLHQ